VPWRGVRGAAKYWIYYLFSSFTTKGAPNCHFIQVRVPPNFFQSYSVFRSRLKNTALSCRNDVRTKNLYVKRWWNWQHDVHHGLRVPGYTTLYHKSLAMREGQNRVTSLNDVPLLTLNLIWSCSGCSRKFVRMNSTRWTSSWLSPIGKGPDKNCSILLFTSISGGNPIKDI
jgi:hypothetical protein